MQTLYMPVHRAVHALSTFRPGASSQPFKGLEQAQTDTVFVEMLNAFRASGGLARLNEVMALTRGVRGDGVARMAAWIIERKVVSFQWEANLWLPLFQFNRSSMTPTPATAEVVRALNPVLGPWALSTWFSRPHALLGNRSPADVLDSNLPAVMRAACAEPTIAVS